MEITLTLEEYQKLKGEKDPKVEKFIEVASLGIVAAIRDSRVAHPDQVALQRALGHALYDAKRAVLNPEQVP